MVILIYALNEINSKYLLSVKDSSSVRETKQFYLL